MDKTSNAEPVAAQVDRVVMPYSLSDVLGALDGVRIIIGPSSQAGEITITAVTGGDPVKARLDLECLNQRDAGSVLARAIEEVKREALWIERR